MTIHLIERLLQGSYQSLIFVWNRLGVLVCNGWSCSVEHCTWSCLLPCCQWWTPHWIHMVFTAETALNKPEEGSALPLQHMSITKSHLILESIHKILQQLYSLLHMLAKHHASNYGTTCCVNDITIWFFTIGFTTGLVSVFSTFHDPLNVCNNRNFSICIQGNKGDKALMPPEWCCSVTFYFEEKYWGDGVDI